MGLTCPQRAFILQIMYLTMNTWHTLTIHSAYQFIVKDQKGFKGAKIMGIPMSMMSHILCWGVPWLIMGTMSIVGIIWNINVFDQDLPCGADGVECVSAQGFNESAGRGFSGFQCTDTIRAENRVVKAVFINTPQLIAVSFYAQASPVPLGFSLL